MEILLCRSNDERRKINKSLSSGVMLEGTLRAESSAVSPVVRVAIDNPTTYNYARIPAFGRYYYIDDAVSVRTGIWDLHLTCDVLMTYADGIMQAVVVLDRTEATGAETYLPGETWKAVAKSKTDILAFSSGLLETGEYILITSGGIGGI